MKYLILICICSCISCFNYKSTSVSTFFSEIDTKYQNASSISYDAAFFVKRFSSDSSKATARVHQVRNPEDKNFKADLWLESDSIICIYTRDTSYLVDLKLKTVKLFTGEYATLPWNSTRRDLLDIFFIESGQFMNAVQDSVLVGRIQQSRSGFEAQMRFRGIPEFADKKLRFHFDRNKKIRRLEFFDKYLEEEQYKSWQLSNLELDKVSSSDLRKQLNSYLATFEKSLYIHENPDKKEKLQLHKFPSFKLKNYATKELELVPNKHSSLVVIDLWYQDCAPCIRAIPHLNALQEKYKNKGLQVIGINPVDIDERRTKRLESFFVKRPLNYPVFLASDELPQALGLQGYPTLFLLDKNDQILYRETGFSIESMNKLDSLIEVRLARR